MSDRQPSRRRSGSGRHVATRPARRPVVRIVQTGVAAALAVSVGSFAAAPSTGGASPDDAGAYSWGAPFTTQTVADRAAALAAREAARTDLADAATQAAARVSQVRSKAAQAQLSGDQLSALDQLEQQVDTLVARVEADRLDGLRLSRSGERAPADDAAEGTLAEDQAASGSAPTGEAAAPGADEGAAATGGAEAAAPAPVGSSDAAQPAGSPSDEAAAPAPAPAPAATASALPVTDPTALSAALPAVAADDDPTASALRDAVLALVTAANQVDAAADAASAVAAAQAERAAWKQSLQGYANGRIPASALCAPSFDSSALLRCDAAEALSALDAAYLEAFGAHLEVSDSYRSYSGQVACRRSKGSLCARPGTSNHGWGVAVDLGGPAHSFGTSAHDWLLANAGTYGWTLPAWARAGGSKPEPWHWEYVG